MSNIQILQSAISLKLSTVQVDYDVVIKKILEQPINAMSFGLPNDMANLKIQLEVLTDMLESLKEIDVLPSNNCKGSIQRWMGRIFSPCTDYEKAAYKELCKFWFNVATQVGEDLGDISVFRYSF
jgi:hypothetical protein